MRLRAVLALAAAGAGLGAVQAERLDGAAAIRRLAGAQVERRDGARMLTIVGVRGSLQNLCWSPDGRRLGVHEGLTRGYNRAPATVRVVAAAGGRAGLVLGPATRTPEPARLVLERRPRRVLLRPGGPRPDLRSRRAGRADASPAPRSGRSSRASRPTAGGSRPSRSHAASGGARSEGAHERQGPDAADVRRRRPSAELGARGRSDRVPAAARGQDLHVVDTDGDGQRNVTRTRRVSETDVSWSPSGDHLVFSSDRDPDIASLFTIGADGRDLRRLTRARGS